ncbi:MAG: adenylosuccinate lyase [Bacteroidota bacterium]
MSISPLMAISPIDGRYNQATAELQGYFSEFALIKYRVWVEVEYLIALSEIPLPQLKSFKPQHADQLREWVENFSEQDALEIKQTEKVTNHDVKAVEYSVKAKLDAMGLSDIKEFVHFGLTSQDINNTAIPATLRDALDEVYLPKMEMLIDALLTDAKKWKDIALLARTHGQAASPTRLGKEICVFIERLEAQLDQLEEIPASAKFGGATGNFNAHYVAFPEIDWVEFANDFLEDKLELHRSQYTTQIEHYDNLASTFDALKRINVILIDLCRDMWTYISMDYFKQKTKEGEVGSSAMPHKVNPIDFENAEGNLGLANAMFEHLSAKLPISRLQRDLTDSTVLRNIGVPMGHTILALQSLMKGWGKLLLNEEQLKADLDKNWAVVAEAIQTILRRENYPQPYETLKKLTRGNEITQSSIQQFIDELEVSDKVKAEMRAITPYTYTGVHLMDEVE